MIKVDTILPIQLKMPSEYVEKNTLGCIFIIGNNY